MKFRSVLVARVSRCFLFSSLLVFVPLHVQASGSDACHLNDSTSDLISRIQNQGQTADNVAAHVEDASAECLKLTEKDSFKRQECAAQVLQDLQSGRTKIENAHQAFIGCESDMARADEASRKADDEVLARFQAKLSYGETLTAAEKKELDRIAGDPIRKTNSEDLLRFLGKNAHRNVSDARKLKSIGIDQHGMDEKQPILASLRKDPRLLTSFENVFGKSSGQVLRRLLDETDPSSSGALIVGNSVIIPGTFLVYGSTIQNPSLQRKKEPRIIPLSEFQRDVQSALSDLSAKIDAFIEASEKYHAKDTWTNTFLLRNDHVLQQRKANAYLDVVNALNQLKDWFGFDLNLYREATELVWNAGERDWRCESKAIERLKTVRNLSIGMMVGGGLLGAGVFAAPAAIALAGSMSGDVASFLGAVALHGVIIGGVVVHDELTAKPKAEKKETENDYHVAPEHPSSPSNAQPPNRVVPHEPHLPPKPKVSSHEAEVFAKLDEQVHLVTPKSRDEMIRKAEQAIDQWKTNHTLAPGMEEFFLNAEVDGQDPNLDATALTQSLRRREDDLPAIKKETDLENLRKFLFDGYLHAYCRDLAKLENFYVDSCGNCEAQTKLVMSAIQDSSVKIPDGQILAVQLFTDHIQPVLYNPQTNEVLELVSGQKVQGIKGDLYQIPLLYYGYLQGQGVQPKIDRSELLIRKADPELVNRPPGKDGVEGPDGETQYELDPRLLNMLLKRKGGAGSADSSDSGNPGTGGSSYVTNSQFNFGTAAGTYMPTGPDGAKVPEFAEIPYTKLGEGTTPGNGSEKGDPGQNGSGGSGTAKGTGSGKGKSKGHGNGGQGTGDGDSGDEDGSGDGSGGGSGTGGGHGKRLNGWSGPEPRIAATPAEKAALDGMHFMKFDRTADFSSRLAVEMKQWPLVEMNDACSSDKAREYGVARIRTQWKGPDGQMHPGEGMSFCENTYTLLFSNPEQVRQFTKTPNDNRGDLVRSVVAGDLDGFSRSTDFRSLLGLLHNPENFTKASPNQIKRAEHALDQLLLIKESEIPGLQAMPQTLSQSKLDFWGTRGLDRHPAFVQLAKAAIQLTDQLDSDPKTSLDWFSALPQESQRVFLKIYSTLEYNARHWPESWESEDRAAENFRRYRSFSPPTPQPSVEPPKQKAPPPNFISFALDPKEVGVDWMNQKKEPEPEPKKVLSEGENSGKPGEHITMIDLSQLISPEPPKKKQDGDLKSRPRLLVKPETMINVILANTKSSVTGELALRWSAEMTDVYRQKFNRPEYDARFLAVIHEISDLLKYTETKDFLGHGKLVLVKAADRRPLKSLVGPVHYGAWWGLGDLIEKGIPLPIELAQIFRDILKRKYATDVTVTFQPWKAEPISLVEQSRKDLQKTLTNQFLYPNPYAAPLTPQKIPEKLKLLRDALRDAREDHDLPE